MEKHYDELASKVEGLIASIQIAESCSVNNSVTIINLDDKNKIINDQNNEMKVEILELKTLTSTCKDHLDNMAQYLRINNIEIVGLPPVDDQIEEEVILEALNNLNDINITSNDIDISHPIPSKRRDGKSVHVVKFVSRKVKNTILNGKKQSRDFKFKDNTIYINDHLAPNNRRLFAAALIKTCELDYKYLWTRNGYVYMRKSDNSQILHINNDETLNSLT